MSALVLAEPPVPFQADYVALSHGHLPVGDPELTARLLLYEGNMSFSTSGNFYPSICGVSIFHNYC